jgi:hippurate hydrolase
MKRIAEGVAAGFGAKAELKIKQGYPATINSVEESRRAASAATKVIGKEKVILDALPSTGSEDFSYMLQARPGCYIWLGNGNRGGGCLLHNPHYDFNDEILPIGTSYWISLVEQELPLT